MNLVDQHNRSCRLEQINMGLFPPFVGNDSVCLPKVSARDSHFSWRTYWTSIAMEHCHEVSKISYQCIQQALIFKKIHQWKCLLTFPHALQPLPNHSIKNCFLQSFNGQWPSQAHIWHNYYVSALKMRILKESFYLIAIKVSQGCCFLTSATWKFLGILGIQIQTF